MNFKWAKFEKEVILQRVRWYLSGSVAKIVVGRENSYSKPY
jgi:hypothetical protein